MGKKACLLLPGLLSKQHLSCSQTAPNFPTCAPSSALTLAQAKLTLSLHMRFSSLILSTWLSMNFWPPKPGLTDMIRTRSTSFSTYSMVDREVPGFSTTPALQPRSLICRYQQEVGDHDQGLGEVRNGNRPMAAHASWRCSSPMACLWSCSMRACWPPAWHSGWMGAPGTRRGAGGWWRTALHGRR